MLWQHFTSQNVMPGQNSSLIPNAHACMFESTFLKQFYFSRLSDNLTIALITDEREF